MITISNGKGNNLTTTTNQTITSVKDFSVKPKINGTTLDFLPADEVVPAARFGSNPGRISNGISAGASITVASQVMTLSPIFIPKRVKITEVQFRTSGSTTIWGAPLRLIHIKLLCIVLLIIYQEVF